MSTPFLFLLPAVMGFSGGSRRKLHTTIAFSYEVAINCCEKKNHLPETETLFPEGEAAVFIIYGLLLICFIDSLLICR